MPIAFPRPTGPYRFDVERQAFAPNKQFDVVPAPTFGNVGTRLSGFRLEPGLSVQKAANLRRLGTQYSASDQHSRVNPAKFLFVVPKQDGSYKRTLGTQNQRIVGVSYNATGARLGTCVIKVFRTEDDVLVASTTSDSNGDWTAYPNQGGPYYFVEYKAGTPDVFGTSPNTNISVPYTPGA